MLIMAGTVVLTLLLVPVLGAAVYLALLTAASLRRPAIPEPSTEARFEVIVPAHDEAEGIEGTVRSLLALDYPIHHFRVVVVADNCTDDTAELARQAGALVRTRVEPSLRGKGYALAFAFEAALAERWADAVVVVDADTTVSRDLLRAFAARLAAGAEVIQADYAVADARESWRTRLMAIAFGAFHVLRSRGRDALGLSVGLRGNGMCFSTRVLAAVPHQAFSRVEDVEHGVRLGEAGRRVWYAGEAHVFGKMVPSERASRSQRRRWEGGRRQLARALGPRVLGRAIERRDRVLLDLGIDVVLPPLATIALGAGGGLLAASVLAHLGAPAALPWAYGAASGALIAYVMRGWSLSGTGARGLLDLLRAPAYVAWKLALAAGADPERGVWVRTARVPSRFKDVKGREGST